jgi:hypothetical protein
MTPAVVAERFEREYGCTTTEWLDWLPGAARACALLDLRADSGVQVQLPQGQLALSWTVLPPRRIALITLPRLQVRFEFVGTTAEQRVQFLRYFDLYMQRGGG